MKPSLALAALLLLGACASSEPGYIGRGDQRVPLKADPSSVVATEIAFNRAAQEEGQWTAFAEYAADGAVMFVPQRVVARDWLSGRANPAAPERWEVREAWSSCDGSAVVVAGLSTDASGNLSRYTRVWRRQQSNRYRWIATMSVPDSALTQARQARAQQRREAGEPPEDAIVVEGLGFIRARTAGCTIPPGTTAPAALPSGAAAGEAGMSNDGTLLWRWQADPSGGGRFAAHFWTGTEWTEVLAETLGAAGA